MCIFGSQQQPPRSGSGGTIVPADAIKPPKPMPSPEAVGDPNNMVADIKIGARKRRASGLTGIRTNTADVNVPANTGSAGTEVINA